MGDGSIMAEPQEGMACCATTEVIVFQEDKTTGENSPGLKLND